MAPQASRPPIPDRDEYGPVGDEQVGHPVEWATVAGWLEEARYYWLVTARPDGRPHAAPVWAVWVDSRVFLTTAPGTVTARVLTANPHALVHLESASEVAIVEGVATRLPPEDVPPAAVDAYARKYGWRIAPDDSGMPYFALSPNLALAWRLPDVRGSAMRWRFKPLLGGAGFRDFHEATAKLVRAVAEVVEPRERSKALEPEHALEERRRPVANRATQPALAAGFGDQAPLHEAGNGRVGCNAANPSDLRT